MSDGSVTMTATYAQKVEHFRLENFVVHDVGFSKRNRHMEITHLEVRTDLETGKASYAWAGYLVRPNGQRFAAGTYRDFILDYDVEAVAVERLRREVGLGEVVSA